MPLRTSTLRGPRPAERLALGLHVPAGVDQFADHLGHGLQTQAPGRGRIAVRAQTEFPQLLARGGLRFGIAHQVDALLGKPEAAARRAGFASSRVRNPAAGAPGSTPRPSVSRCCVTRSPRRGCTRRSSNFSASSTSSGGTTLRSSSLDITLSRSRSGKGICFSVISRVIQGNAPPSSRRADLAARHQKPALHDQRRLASIPCAPRRGAASR